LNVLLVLGTHELDQLVIGHESLTERHGPRPCVRFSIVDSDLDIQPSKNWAGPVGSTRGWPGEPPVPLTLPLAGEFPPAGVLPEAREIRLAVGRPRRRRIQIRPSVGRSRKSRGGVMRPLRREHRRERRDEGYRTNRPEPEFHWRHVVFMGPAEAGHHLRSEQCHLIGAASLPMNATPRALIHARPTREARTSQLSAIGSQLEAGGLKLPLLD
jgi:hypothetical protein